jgi:Spy/CpxP family protein refolding chaperone
VVLLADDDYANDCYVTDNDQTIVYQGALTPEQKKWLGENHNKPIDAITCLPLTPAQKLYLALCKNGFNLPEALASCGLNADEAAEAQQPLKIRDADGVVKEITRPTFVGAALNGYDLQGADLYGADLRHADLREANLQGADLWEADLEFANLQGADLYGADLREADLREANLQDAKMQGADLSGAKMQGTDLQGADLSLTDLSGADFYNAENLNTVILTNAFYDAENPPKNLPDNIPDNIKDNLLALDKKSYEKAKELQAAYREALVSDNENETAITDAEKALTEHLGKCREENAKKAIQQAAPVLGAEAIPILVKKLAGSAVRVTDGLPTTAASLSGQQGVSLDGGNVDPYTQYGYGSR